MDFIIDTEGDQELLEKHQLVTDTSKLSFTDVDSDTLPQLIEDLKKFKVAANEEDEKKKKLTKKSSEKKCDNLIDDFFIRMGWGKNIGEQTAKNKLKQSKNKFIMTNIDFETGKLKMAAVSTNVDKILEKSVLTPDIEKLVSLPEYNVSDRRLKAIRKREREKTKGPSWYNLPAPEITEEIQNDLQVLKMRSALDPKHFYKKNDMKVLPKYFQMGKVMDSALDHHNVRLTKKERKRTLVDELMADAEFNRYNKQKYKEIIEEKRQTTYKTYIKDKRKKNKAVYKEKVKEGKIKKKSKRNKSN